MFCQFDWFQSGIQLQPKLQLWEHHYGIYNSHNLNPFHPYTKALLSAVPLFNQKDKKKNKNLLTGDIPSPIERPSGCCFHTRCPFVMGRCKEEAPTFQKINNNHWGACHLN